MYIAAGATFLIEWDASTAKTFGVWCSAFTRLDPRSLPQGTPRTSDSWLLSIAPQTAALPIPLILNPLDACTLLLRISAHLHVPFTSPSLSLQLLATSSLLEPSTVPRSKRLLCLISLPLHPSTDSPRHPHLYSPLHPA